MSDFTLKVGDRSPSISAQLFNPDGTNPSLVGATVTFRMKNTSTGAIITGSAVVDDAGQAKVHYAWGASDTLVAGTYNAEWRVVDAGGIQSTYPNDGFFTVSVIAGAS